MVLVLIFTIVPAKASANTAYNHNELLEYKGYGETMYESIVEETTFITGQYTDNKQFVGDSIDQVKDYAKFWLDEQKKINNSCGGTALFTKECAGELVTSGGGYLLTVGDFVKKMFTGYGEEYHPQLANNDFHNRFVTKEEGTKNTYKVNAGYQLHLLNDRGEINSTYSNTSGFNRYIFYVNNLSFDNSSAELSFWIQGIPKSNPIALKTKAEVDFWLNFREKDDGNFSNIIMLVRDLFGIEMVFETDQGETVPYIEDSKNDFNDFKKYIDEQIKNIAIPEPKPSLTCPNGEKINLTVNGSTFLKSDGTVMLVNKDGTATVNGTSCDLAWQAPEMGYKDNVAVMEDKDDNLIDMLTGVITCMAVPNKQECLLDKVPEKDVGKVEPLDTSLLEYIKNAYTYATQSLKVATDGLKSLANGAKDLTSLFGVFFSWLPREMVVLMSSGLGLMIALRLFRK